MELTNHPYLTPSLKKEWGASPNPPCIFRFFLMFCMTSFFLRKFIIYAWGSEIHMNFALLLLPVRIKTKCVRQLCTRTCIFSKRNANRSHLTFKAELQSVLFKDPVRTSRKTLVISVIKPITEFCMRQNSLFVLRYAAIMYTHYGQDLEFGMLKLTARTATSRLLNAQLVGDKMDKTICPHCINFMYT